MCGLLELHSRDCSSLELLLPGIDKRVLRLFINLKMRNLFLQIGLTQGRSIVADENRAGILNRNDTGSGQRCNRRNFVLHPFREYFLRAPDLLSAERLAEWKVPGLPARHVQTWESIMPTPTRNRRSELPAMSGKSHLIRVTILLPSLHLLVGERIYRLIFCIALHFDLRP